MGIKLQIQMTYVRDKISIISIYACTVSCVIRFFFTRLFFIFICVEAKFSFVRDLNVLREMKQYNFPVPDKSKSSQSPLSIIRCRFIKRHHSKQAPAALAKSFRFRKRKTKTTEGISFSKAEVIERYCVYQFFLTYTIRCRWGLWKRFYCSLFPFLRCEDRSPYMAELGLLPQQERDKIVWHTDFQRHRFDFLALEKLADLTPTCAHHFTFSVFWNGAKVIVLTRISVATLRMTHFFTHWNFANKKRAGPSHEEDRQSERDAKCGKSISVRTSLNSSFSEGKLRETLVSQRRQQTFMSST